MCLHKPPTNQKSQASPFNLFRTGVFKPLENPKELGLIMGRYADTLITNPGN